MNDIDLETELKVAKSAALAAGKILKTKKSDLNVETFSSERDIKLEADVVAEALIKEIIQDESNIAILAEESGKSSENLGDIFWVIDPLDGTANYSRNIPPLQTAIPNFYMANLQQVYPWDRGTNYAVELGQKVASQCIKK